MADWTKLRKFLSGGDKKVCKACNKSIKLDSFYDPYVDKFVTRCNECIAKNIKYKTIKRITKRIWREKYRLGYLTDKLAKSSVLRNTKRRACILTNRFDSGTDIKKVYDEILGCNNESLCEYLESLFAEGMNWVNYGHWHIDHIRPCASFDLTDPEQQKQCFHYTNLQPLWARDNLRKSSKWEGIRAYHKTPVKSDT